VKEPRWIDVRAFLLLHSASLAEHGGRTGIRDQAALASALARPRNRFAYDKDVDIASLAAAYSFGITRNHPFHDGNKRSSFQAAELFIVLNGYELAIRGDAGAIQAVVELAEGRLSEEDFAAWLRTRLKKR
jgi:death-on-curing protein